MDYPEGRPDDPHTFRWFQQTSRKGGAWGTIWTRRAKRLSNGVRTQRAVRLHLRKTTTVWDKGQLDYSVAHDLSRGEAWRIGWALVVRSLTR